MNTRIDFEHVRQKWQRLWQEKGLFIAHLERVDSKYYFLNMFPYPKGQKHIAQARHFFIVDTYTRFLKLQGYNVLSPLGFDAFGLPAESAAREHHVDPKKWTYENIELFRASFQAWGIEYERDREIITCEPDYYKWTQWLFLQFYKHSLAYRKITTVDWCPQCATVLAKEQIDQEACQNCGSPIEYRRLPQWFLKITQYAEELFWQLDELQWPEHIKLMQRNWIGRIEGANINCVTEQGDVLEVFVAQPDKIYGGSYLVLAPDNPLLESLVIPSRRAEVDHYLAEVATQSRHKKRRLEGVFTGTYASHPLNGRALPIWISDYVELEHVPAFLGIPAHNKDDWEFAKEANLPIISVIEADPQQSVSQTLPYTSEGTLLDSGVFTGRPTGAATVKEIYAFLEKEHIGCHQVKYRLHDWLISRQRYWGTPIPIIHCPGCGIVAVPEVNLPVMLPDAGSDIRNLADMSEFYQVNCPCCGQPARRETDTLDTFVDSSWYFLRYLSPHNGAQMFNQEIAQRWFPVDLYLGGRQYTTSHLLYARFVTKVLRDLGALSVSEPFPHLFTFGTIQARAYRCPTHGWLRHTEVRQQQCIYCNQEVETLLTKMSTSRRNFVEVSDLLEQYSADTVRVAILWLGPHDQDIQWNWGGVQGAHRWLARVWQLFDRYRAIWQGLSSRETIEDTEGNENDAQLAQALTKYSNTIISAFSSLHFHTAISQMMELTNVILRYCSLCQKADVFPQRTLLLNSLHALILFISPVAPFLAEEIWAQSGQGGSVFEQQWLRTS